MWSSESELLAQSWNESKGSDVSAWDQRARNFGSMDFGYFFCWEVVEEPSPCCEHASRILQVVNYGGKQTGVFNSPKPYTVSSRFDCDSNSPCIARAILATFRRE